MLSITNLSIHFGGRYLFDNISFTVTPNDRIGLIGRNGTGKSTLLKIIYGLEVGEEGKVSKANEYRIGYLPQENNNVSDTTVYKEAAKALAEILNLEKTIHDIADEISSRTDYESDEYMDLMHKMSDANDRFKIAGGHSAEADIEQVLTGLGFDRNEFGRPLNQFSGGWQMRVELAKILLAKPDCILLDEPTNHLDIESIQWLENFLRNYEGSVIIVSHDRTFLDSVTNRTIEISNGKIYDYPLSYSRFIEQRVTIREQQMAAFKNQQRQIADTERFIERFRSKASLATRVQSKIKLLDKVERIEVDEEDTASIRFRFPEAVRSGRLLAEAKSLSKKYEIKLILDKVDFAIERGEKIAFVGKNGEGKSTFSKILAGIESYDGVLTLGHNISVGYYAQHQAEMLDGDSSVFEIIDGAATGEIRTKVRSLLGAFLFRGDDIYKKVKVLSGGEKSRLSLCKLLLQPTNFLILDEPTNHLDMIAKDVLKHSLMEYKGAMIIVSHDRSFLHELTRKTCYFKDKKIKEYPGDIYEFLDKQRIEHLNELESNRRIESGNNDVNAEKQSSQTQLDREERKKFQREENKLKKLISKCEEEISSMEAKMAVIDAEFANPELYSDVKNTKKRQGEYQDIRKILNKRMEEWTALNQQYEELSGK